MNNGPELHDCGPPDVPRLLAILEDHQVRYVISGSVAARIYGVELVPGDLDIVPSRETDNLVRLVEVLKVIEARPSGPFGEWEVQPDGEMKWISRPTTPQEVAAWTPSAKDLSTLDCLFRTRLGNFDVVPEITGSFDELKQRAVQLPAHGFNPWVAHVDDLIARLTVPRREKDIPRVTGLRKIQRELP